MTTKIPKISAKFYTTLAKKVNVADITATLNSIADLDSDNLPSGRYGFTIDEGNSSVEYFEADLSGTALSGIKALHPTTLVETVGFLKEHRAGAEVKITDFTVLARLRNVLLGIEDLDDGAPIKYGASPTLSDPLMLATVEYVLSVVNGGTVSFDNQVIAGIAGESISSGQWVYFKESDGRWYKTDANTQATVKNVKIGMAKGAGTTGNAISGGVFVGGIEKTGTYVAGNTYYLSNTAGALSTTAGEFEALVGIADANGELVFLNVYDPEGTTPDEKDALVGTVGTPNTNNKFVTQNNTSSSTTDQTQTTQDSTLELGEANATTKKNKIAQSFIPTKEKIRAVSLYKIADTGTFTGTVTVSIQSDSSGNPDGVALATKTITNAEWLLLPTGENEIEFTSEYSSLVCLPSTKYWVVVATSTSDTSNHPNLGFNSAGGYANGTLKYNNTSDGWVEISGDDLYFKTHEGNANQVVKTGSDGKIPLPIMPFNGVVGVLDHTYKKLWFNAQMLFILWTGASSGDATTSFANWQRRSTDVVSAPSGLYANFGNTGSEYMYVQNAIHTGSGILKFSDTNKVILDFIVKLPTSSTGVITMGFGGDGTSNYFDIFERTFADANDDKILFQQDTDGVLYATIQKAGTGRTQTAVGSFGGKVTNLRIELDLGSEARFYVDGTLKATLSGANLPTVTEQINIGFGRSDTADFTVFCPTISLEMNP